MILAAMSLVGGFSLTGPAAAQAETPADINADFLAACLGAYGEDSNAWALMARTATSSAPARLSRPSSSKTRR
jgi:hypothetical protein